MSCLENRHAPSKRWPPGADAPLCSYKAEHLLYWSLGKCDGSRPSCARCSSRSQVCRYASNEDGRKPASKAYVDLLRGRISTLEHTLQAHSINVDDSVASVPAGGSSSIEGRPRGCSPSHGDVTDPGRLQISQIGSGGTLSTEESLNYERDGEFRYFGPTSGRQHFRAAETTSDQDAVNSQPTGLPNSEKTHPKYQSPRVDLSNLMQTPDGPALQPALKHELVSLYFTWQNPWLNVVDESLYRQSSNTQGRYWSPLLENCILAMGSRFTENVAVRVDPEDCNSAGQLFHEKAEVLLFYDMKHPTLTTIQSLLIMSNLSVVRPTVHRLIPNS